MARRKLLDWERDAIVMAMASGEKREAICAEFDVCVSYPSVLARRRGIPSRGVGRPKKLQIDKQALSN